MSTVYLVRHGQAGTRDAYDSVSELGRRQSCLLGEHFLSLGIRFASAYTGALLRQQQTAKEVSAAYARAGVPFPTVAVDPQWNEFDLARVHSEIAPLLAAEDVEFRVQYEQMREEIRTNKDVQGATIHRKWLPCDTKLVRAWISSRYPYTGERWDQFRERIMSCKLTVGDAQHRENIIVFTSATPIAIWTGCSLDLLDEPVMRLAGVLYNASYSVMRLRNQELQLFTFNAAPHLVESGLRTHR